MWKLAKNTGVLDLNSVYSYLMLCKYFSETCVIAENKSEIQGFVTGFCPPDLQDTVFVWQVAVDASCRGKGVARTMLMELLKRPACAGFRYLETTVTNSNIPSQALFRRFAKDVGAMVDVSPCFPETLFPQSAHEAEWLYRIGPIQNIKKGVGSHK